VDLVERVKPVIAQIPGVSTFEVTTAIGFMAMAESRVDIAVVEVGLGAGWTLPMWSHRCYPSSHPFPMII